MIAGRHDRADGCARVPARDRTFLTYLGVNGRWEPAMIPDDALACENLLLCDYFVAPLLRGRGGATAARHGARRGARTLFDTSWDPDGFSSADRAEVRGLLPRSTYFCPTRSRRARSRTGPGTPAGGARRCRPPRAAGSSSSSGLRMLCGRAGRGRDLGPGAGRHGRRHHRRGRRVQRRARSCARGRGGLARGADEGDPVRHEDHLPTLRRPLPDRADGGGRMKLAVIGAGSTYTPELVSGLTRERERLDVRELVLHDIDRRAARGRRRDWRSGCSSARASRRARAHRRARSSARRRRHHPDPDPRRRAGGAAAGRDDPGGLRLRRPGDDRRRWAREGDADRAGRARDRAAGARARDARRLDHRLHQSGRDRDPSAARRRTSCDRPVQRRDQLPAPDRRASRRGRPSGCSSTRSVSIT